MIYKGGVRQAEAWTVCVFSVFGFSVFFYLRPERLWVPHKRAAACGIHLLGVCRTAGYCGFQNFADGCRPGASTTISLLAENVPSHVPYTPYTRWDRAIQEAYAPDVSCLYLILNMLQVAHCHRRRGG